MQEKHTLVEDDNLGVILEPKVGTFFDSELDALICYHTYGNSVGFGVITKSSKKNDYGKKSHIVYSCHRAGKSNPSNMNPIKPQPTSKLDCKAQMRISLQVDGKWRLNSIVLEHNHEMVEPEKLKYLRCNRYIPEHAKRVFELNGAVGIRINKTMASCVIEAGGPNNLSYTEKHMRNYLDGVRRLQLQEGDAEAMSRYFRKMQLDNSDFFYVIDVNEENRLRNVFWADARSREAYKEFGDVITFDTTYLVNKFDMPFAPFVGVNHHGQSILFGCGLVSREDTDSFVWLFKAWLECMFGLQPNAVITDQCKAMQNAIIQVFPNARHRWCLWHIMKKIREKLKSYDQYQSIKFRLKNVVYDSLYPNEFEKNWDLFIKEFKLENNAWLSGLYEAKTRWVPAFVKDTFWAGMSTTQRSESINAFFDGYVHSNTSLKEFVEQYENALGKKVQKEEEEDARCMNVRVVELISPYQFEEQFQKAYTLEKFKQFLEQVGLLIGCNLKEGLVGDGTSEFIISQNVKVGKKHPICKHYTFTVRYIEQSGETNCNCRMFESKRMVCAHMIKVWGHKMLDKVSDKYIVKRWKKNMARSHNKVKVSYTKWQSKAEWHRFDHIQNVSREATNMAMYSNSKTAIVVAKLREAMDIVQTMQDDDCVTNVPISCDVVGDPAKRPRIGRPPENRKQSTAEKIVQKRPKKYSKIDQPKKVDINNESIEVYRPILTQESTDFYPSQMTKGYSTEFDDDFDNGIFGIDR